MRCLYFQELSDSIRMKDQTNDEANDGVEHRSICEFCDVTADLLLNGLKILVEAVIRQVRLF